MNGHSFALRLGHDGGVEDVAIDSAPPRCDRSSLLWIHVDGRDEAALAWLRDRAGLPPGAVVALTAVETRPRCEEIGSGALVNLRGLGAVRDDDDPDDLVSIRLFSDEGRIVSLAYRRLGELERICAKMRAGRLKDPGDLIVALAIEITANLDTEIAQLGDEVDECEAKLDPTQSFQMRRTIARVRSEAIGYRRFVVPQREALGRLAALEVDWLEESDRVHLREAADRFARMAEELEAVRERAALMHEQLTDLRAEMLDTRSLLIAVVAMVFLPLTFITGLLGMNVDGIPYAHEPWAFEAVCAICVAIAGAVAAYFMRAHWFRG